MLFVNRVAHRLTYQDDDRIGQVIVDYGYRGAWLRDDVLIHDREFVPEPLATRWVPEIIMDEVGFQRRFPRRDDKDPVIYEIIAGYKLNHMSATTGWTTKWRWMRAWRMIFSRRAEPRHHKKLMRIVELGIKRLERQETTKEMCDLFDELLDGGCSWKLLAALQLVFLNKVAPENVNMFIKALEHLPIEEPLSV